jgi:hypothetical protein
MKTVSNKFLIVGTVAVAAVFMTGIVSMLGLQEANAEKPRNQNNCGDNQGGLNVVVCANVPVCAQVNVIAENNKNNC